jgi:membrane-associated phospholipid phosphatase
MDQGLFDQVNRFAVATPWLHGAVAAYANYGIVLFGLLLVAGWWTARRRDPRAMALALLAGVSTLVAVGVNQPIVRSVAEARPYTTHPHILVLATRSADFSFPSDHAVMAGAATAGLWLVSRRLGALATAAALLMAFARVYIAAHYPHDVVVGLLLGAAVAVGLGLAAKAPLASAVEALSGTRWLRPVLTARPRPTA